MPDMASNSCSLGHVCVAVGNGRAGKKSCVIVIIIIMPGTWKQQLMASVQKCAVANTTGYGFDMISLSLYGYDISAIPTDTVINEEQSI